MRKNKKLLLGGLSVLTLVAAGSGAVSTFAWYKTTNNATINGINDTKTAGVIASSATAAQVDFTCSASVDYTNDVNNAATGLVLTNTAGQTGYVANDTVYLRALKDAESGYATVTVTVTASLHAGAEGTFYQAWQSLSAQSKKIYPAIKGTGTLRAAFSTGTSEGGVYHSYTENDMVYGSDIFSSFKEASNDDSGAIGGAIDAHTLTASASYTCYFSIAPKYDGDKANGAAMGNTLSYDQATDHDTEDTIVVNVSETNS